MVNLIKRHLQLNKRSMGQIFIYVVDQFLPISPLADMANYCLYQIGNIYVFVKEKLFHEGKFNWRSVKDEFFKWYFAYYQEEQVDFNKRPELRGLITEWVSAEELVRHLKIGDLIEFKGTSSGMTLFHHWSVCVRVNNEIDVRKRNPSHVRMLHLSRVGKKALTGRDLFDNGIVFVSAKIHIKTLSETHMTRLCRINNSLDLKWKPFGGKEVAKFALTWRGCARYNGTLWNCEHFVKCCRYGHGESYQTEMISTLVTLFLIHLSLLSFIQLPAWISLNLAWMFGFFYYLGLYYWRCLENVAFVFMRQHNIPISIFNIPDCFEKMTKLELFYVFCFWLFTVAIRLYLLFISLYFWNIDLFPKFGIIK